MGRPPRWGGTPGSLFFQVHPSPQLCPPPHHISLGDPLLTPTTPMVYAWWAASQSGLAGGHTLDTQRGGFGFPGLHSHSGAPLGLVAMLEVSRPIFLLGPRLASRGSLF